MHFSEVDGYKALYGFIFGVAFSIIISNECI